MDLLGPASDLPRPQLEPQPHPSPSPPPFALAFALALNFVSTLAPTFTLTFTPTATLAPNYIAPNYRRAVTCCVLRAAHRYAPLQLTTP